MRIRSVYPKVAGGSDDLRKRLDHLFAPLDLQSSETAVPTLTILWSSTKHISLHSTSSMWMPDSVVPLLPKPEVGQPFIDDSPIYSCCFIAEQRQ